MDIEIKSAKDLSRTDLKDIHNLIVGVFPSDISNQKWAEIDWHVLINEQDHIVTHVGIVERRVTVGGNPVSVGGISAVGTLSKWCGRGYASSALKHAATFIREELKLKFGLLMCNEELVPLYQRLAWKIVESPLVYDQPSGKVKHDLKTMVLCCSLKEWPEGPIDLCGFPW